MATESDKLAKEPLNYSTNIKSTLLAQGLEIYTATTPMTYKEQWIGEFWSDDIYKLTFEPAGRWIAIASEVIKQENASLDKAVYTYAKVGMGLSDVGSPAGTPNTFTTSKGPSATFNGPSIRPGAGA